VSAAYLHISNIHFLLFFKKRIPIKIIKRLSLILLLSAIHVTQYNEVNMQVHEFKKNGQKYKVIQTTPDIVFGFACRFYKETTKELQDYEKAFKLFQAAAMQKEDIETRAKAIFNLGTTYFNGEGVEVNTEAGITCFFIAAQQNNVEKAKKAGQKTLSESTPEKPAPHTPKKQLLLFAQVYNNGELVEKNDFLCRLCIRATALQDSNLEVRKTGSRTARTNSR